MAIDDIDDIDRLLLVELAADARLSLRELGRRIGMAPGSVRLRVERLEQAGVIRGYHAQIDAEQLGHRVRALVGLQVTQGATVTETANRLQAIPEVRSVSLVTGSWDFVVELLARDQEHLREVLIGEVWRLPVFRHSETMVVLDHAERTGGDVPQLAAPLP